MKILTPYNEKILAIIGEQPVFANKDYRFMKYCLEYDVPEGKLVFNGLTRTLIIIEPNDNISDIISCDYLYKKYFLVPEDFDETTLVDKLKEHFRKPLDDLYLTHPKSFIVFTTTKCNARCFYCYELHQKNKTHMTEETANKVGDYIVRYSDRNSSIHIGFFGGEPLFNQKPIDIVINKVMNAGLPYYTTFITNGYLFTPELANKAKNLWKTTNVQITIDGTESVYNKTKNYIYDGSPYKVVLNNIAALLNRGIPVVIRLNVDLYNADNLKVLIKQLHDRFGNHPLFQIYTWPIFEDEYHHRTEEENELLFKKLKEIEDLLAEYEYEFGKDCSSEIKAVQCMADNGENVTISPRGELGVCEHYTDSHFWGHIDNPLEKDFEELKSWKEYNDLDMCKDCPLYPSCVLPKNCEEMGKCDKYYQEWRLRRHIYGMYCRYKKALHPTTYNPIRLSENE